MLNIGVFLNPSNWPDIHTRHLGQKEINMDKYRDELDSLDQELNRYQRKIEKIRFLVAFRLIKKKK